MYNVIKGVAATIAILATALPLAARSSDPAPTFRARHADLPLEGVITDPEWAERPSGEVLGDYYPKMAAYFGISGKVILNCSVTTLGAVEACKLVKETPMGLGFGEAALAVTQFYKMKPRTVDGVPVGGSVVQIPTNWRMDNDPHPTDPVPADAQAPAPNLIALARRVVLALGGVEKAARYYRRSFETAKLSFGIYAETPQGRALALGFDKAIDHVSVDYSERLAVIYARLYSQPDLLALATFFESPAGRSWIRGNETMTPSREFLDHSVWEQALSDARRTLCAQGDCADPSAPAARK